MVTAGVFLLVRCMFLFENAPEIFLLLLFTGSLTTFFAGSVGGASLDIKRVIAFSTCSQLGLMFLICGCSNSILGFFHLFNHAYFKALLFLCAGFIIHTLFDEQDLRKMGGISVLLPFNYICVLVGSLAIGGMPFLTGFYSKDFILEGLLFYSSYNSFFFLTLGCCSIFLTGFYSFRLGFHIFTNCGFNSNAFIKQMNEGF
jgi:NADH:ubiquinone oxidoreductase subunit 5 (subunit L)/multisubunit Na+/H+ antiporter MnhA subunit